MTAKMTATDGQLLDAFVAGADENAFRELVRRHGAMVRCVCIRVLMDPHEAEDVAQAAFVTLARKAASLRNNSSVGGWLHRVTWCLAMDVRRAREHRRRREEAAMREACSDRHDAANMTAFSQELDAAVAGLPERYRRPVVLFHMEGHAAEETAQALGLNPSTLRTRLMRARELLRKRLVRRGVQVGSVGALTTLFAAETGAAVLPEAFVTGAVRAAASVAATGNLAGGIATGAIAPRVAEMAEGAMKMMVMAQMKTAAVAVAVAGLAITGGVMAGQPKAEHARSSEAKTGPRLEVGFCGGNLSVKNDGVKDLAVRQNAGTPGYSTATSTHVIKDGSGKVLHSSTKTGDRASATGNVKTRIQTADGRTVEFDGSLCDLPSEELKRKLAGIADVHESAASNSTAYTSQYNVSIQKITGGDGKTQTLVTVMRGDEVIAKDLPVEKIATLPEDARKHVNMLLERTEAGRAGR